MKKILLLSILICLLAVSCAVEPSVGEGNPRTLYIVSSVFTYGEGETYSLPVINNLDFLAAVEELYNNGHSGFDEINEVIFQEDHGVFYTKTSSSDSGTRGKWTLLDDVVPALRNVHENADSNDLFLFFFSGHGAEDKNNIENMGALCFYNPENAEAPMEFLLPSTLSRLFSEIGCNVLMVINACHSGAIAELADGTMADGLKISNSGEEGNEPGSLDVTFSVAKAIGNAFALQLDSSKTGNGNLWVLTAATIDQSEYMFGDVTRSVWAPFIDFATQALSYDEESGKYIASGSSRLNVTDIYNYIINLSKQPMMEAQTTFPEEYKESFIEEFGENITLLDTQVARMARTPVDLVVFDDLH